MSYHHLRKETNTILAATSFQVVAESNEVSTVRLHFSRANSPRSFSCSLYVLLFHPFTNFIVLHMLEQLNILLVMKGPKLNTERLPASAGYRKTITSLVLLTTLLDTSQKDIGLLGFLGTLLFHVQTPIDPNQFE